MIFQDLQLDEIGGRKGTKSVSKFKDTLVSYAEKLNLSSLAESLLKNKEINNEALIHNKCRTELRNVSRKRLSTTEYVNFSNKRLSARSESKRFDFKTQCFYCESRCVDFKHPAQIAINLKRLEQKTLWYIRKLLPFVKSG